MTKIVSKLRLQLVTADTTYLGGKKFEGQRGRNRWAQLLATISTYHLVKFTNPTFCPKGVKRPREHCGSIKNTHPLPLVRKKGVRLISTCSQFLSWEKVNRLLQHFVGNFSRVVKTYDRYPFTNTSSATLIPIWPAFLHAIERSSIPHLKKDTQSAHSSFFWAGFSSRNCS